jgi:hypothetical protein
MMQTPDQLSPAEFWENCDRNAEFALRPFGWVVARRIA